MKALRTGSVLAAVAGLSLAACGGGGGSSNPAVPPQPPAPPAVTATPSPTPTQTASPTPTPTPTPTPVPMLTTADYSLQPVFLCVNHPSGPTFNLRFGYRNLNAFDVQVPRGSTDPSTGAKLNALTVTSGEGATSDYTQQPVLFLSGDQTTNADATFEVPVGGESSATWYLAGNEVTGTTSGPSCSTRGGA